MKDAQQLISKLAKDPAARRRNPHLFQQTPVGDVVIVPRKNRVRQSKTKLNKLEEEFLEQLKARGIKPYSHDLIFRLANDVRYTPEFVAMVEQPQGGVYRIMAWEVKGNRAWDDAIVKIKLAPEAFPEIEWHLCWKDREGQWMDQLMLPK